METVPCKIGTPILEGLTPIIQGITSALQRMSETAASADLAGDMKDFTDAVDAANAEYEESEQLIEHNAIKADLLKQRLEELARKYQRRRMPRVSMQPSSIY